MFIVSPNKGGYRHDVNTAFRQGRADAFQDYIANFDVARKADAVNNAENQRQVERIAGNYAKELGMGVNARKDILDFYKKNDAINNAMLDNQINASRVANLAPQADALGQSQAVEFTNKQLTGEVNSTYNANQANHNLGQQEVKQKADAINNQTDVTNAETNAVKADIGKMYTNAQSDLVTFQQNGMEEISKRFVERYVAQARQKAQENGQTFDEERYINELKNSQAFQDGVKNAYDTRLGELRQKVTDLGSQLGQQQGTKTQAKQQEKELVLPTFNSATDENREAMQALFKETYATGQGKRFTNGTKNFVFNGSQLLVSDGGYYEIKNMRQLEHLMRTLGLTEIEGKQGGAGVNPKGNNGTSNETSFIRQPSRTTEEYSYTGGFGGA